MRTEEEIRNAIANLQFRQKSWKAGSQEYNKYVAKINALKWVLNEIKSYS